MKRPLTLAAAALVPALPAPGSAATVSVKIVPGAFQPAISSGDVVQSTNDTSVNRQLVADYGSFASPTLERDQTFSFTSKTAGSYAYHDGLHPSGAHRVPAAALAGGLITVKRLVLGPNSRRIFTAPRHRGYRMYRVVLVASQAGVGYMNSWSNAARVRYRR